MAFLCVAAEARCRGTRGRSELGGVCSRACHVTVCAKSSGNARAFLAMCVFGALPLCVCVCVLLLVKEPTLILLVLCLPCTGAARATSRMNNSRSQPDRRGRD